MGRIIERIYNRCNGHKHLYLFRIKLTPHTWWGQLYFHVFYRGDMDRAAHDHPWPFWTFPFVSYWEVVRNTETGFNSIRKVERFRLHYREAKHTHRLIDPPRQKKIYTLFWHGAKIREWGFWDKKTWVHWKEYLDVDD